MRLPSGMRLVNMLCGWWTLLVLLFLYLPIALLVVYSFNTSRMNVNFEGFTTHWYGEMFGDSQLGSALKNSLVIAAWTTAISVSLGTVGAWLLHRHRYRFQKMWEALLFIPMAVPEIIMGVSLLILFTAVGPTLNGWLDALFGVTSSPRFGLGMLTVIISHVTFCFPFVLVAVQARLADVDPYLEEAALDLGATPLQAFMKVMVPYMMPAIVSGALMAFTLSMDEILVTYFVNGPESKTLPQEIFSHVKRGVNPKLNAISTVFIVATAGIVLLAEWLRKRK